jgi:hypothetical protein
LDVVPKNIKVSSIPKRQLPRGHSLASRTVGRTARTGQPEQDSQNRTARAVEPVQVSQERTVRTGQSGQYSQYRTVRLGQPEQD